MTDDQWRRSREEDGDFGPPLFSDDSLEQEAEGDLSFGDGDTGPLPHWTQPPTGQLPSVLSSGEQSEDLDVWSSFSGSTPAWRDHRADESAQGFEDITGLHPVFESTEHPIFEDPEPTGQDESAPLRREPGRIMIGTDPTDGAMSRPQPPGRRPRPGDVGPRGGRPTGRPTGRPATSRAGAPKPSGGTAGRDMPTAIAVGLIIAVVFIGALKYKTWAVATIVVVVLGLAAVEYFDRVREKGYQPALIPGIVACVAAPVAVYHYGVAALPLVTILAFAACAANFIFSDGLESSPMPNMAISTLGITWIGVLGSFGAALVALSNSPTAVACCAPSANAKSSAW